jgi:hypothetical protein
LTLPRRLAEQFPSSDSQLVGVTLDVSSPHFHLYAGDILLLDKGCSTLEPVSELYAALSTAGLLDVGSEALLQASGSELLPTGENGQT